jgi:hypothetical protein
MQVEQNQKLPELGELVELVQSSLKERLSKCQQYQSNKGQHQLVVLNRHLQRLPVIMGCKIAPPIL